MRIYAIGLVTPFILMGCDGDSASDDNSATISASSLSNSSACFNTELHQVGTEVIATYAKTGGGGTLNRTEHSRLSGPVTYQGHNDVIAIEEVGKNDTTYVVFDDSAKSVTTLGQIVDGTETEYLPSGLLLDYALEQNQTRTYPTVSVTENDVIVATMDVSFTFLMSESITVPAGTFDTCKFKLSIKGTEADGHSYETVFDQNIGVDNGILIHVSWSTITNNATSYAGTETLTSASINGNPI
ncbi:hypothetical protein AB4520_09185 [Vibrio renipiscarius]|uniref:hypothetical protein n=1 Tax=Vibrio renipiscarius TaxID=1461322 RepID=UPI00354DDEA7